MNYYRKTIDNVVDNVKLKMQMAAFTLKLLENKNNISSNTSLIDTNKNNISSNTSLIDTQQTTLSNIDNDLTNLRGGINTHQTDIQNINTNINNLKNGYKLKDILVFNITNNVSKAMSQSNPSFVIFTGIINNNIKKDSYIEFNLSIYMLFLLHYINAQFFYILLKVLNKNNQLITSIQVPLIGMISKQGIVSNTCYLIMPNNYENVKIEMSIELKEDYKRNDIIKILDFDNYIYCKIFEKLDNSIEFDV